MPAINKVKGEKIYFGAQFQRFWFIAHGSVDSGSMLSRISWQQRYVEEEATHLMADMGRGKI
jgi:hypothetical protein